MRRDHAEDDRTMRRLGLLETTHEVDEQRDNDAIDEEFWWRFVRLVWT
jgi:hypothetical protein